MLKFPSRCGGDEGLSSDGEEMFLHTELSEQLLERLCQNRTDLMVEKNQMSDLALSLFDPETTRLRSARLTNATKLTVEGLKALHGHKILELEMRGLAKATVTDVVDECLGN